MFVVLLSYKKPIEVVDQHLIEHRQFLEEGYQKHYFIASGPQNPRTGGVIISQLKDRAKLEAILKNDPFSIHAVAEYKLIEFEPVKFHQDFAGFV